MELFVALILVFLGGMTSYGLAHVWIGTRDLWRQVGGRWGPSVSLRDAREGRVRLCGEARAARKLLPALTRDAPGCMAYVRRSGFGRDSEENATTFELFDGTGVARIEAKHPVVCAPEREDVFGGLTREIRPGDRVTVIGQLVRLQEPGGTFDSYREAPTSLVVRDLPGGAGLVLHRRTWQPLRTMTKGVFALLLSALGVWVTVSTIVV